MNKNLTLKNENNFSFYSLNRFFALSLDKIGGTSTIKIKMAFYFALSSVCTIFAEKMDLVGTNEQETSLFYILKQIKVSSK